ncbi:hypothetical protein BY996DRAFT_7577242 [Phakopsora pachyrhizi]|nr:hypothetical protein BY996DRAFT_7577242 [Phakopsora pachyrhizi]
MSLNYNISSAFTFVFYYINVYFNHFEASFTPLNSLFKLLGQPDNQREVADLISAKRYLGFYYQSTADDFKTASRKDLVKLSKGIVPNSFKSMLLGHGHLRTDLNQGPIIKLNSDIKISYIEALSNFSKRAFPILVGRGEDSLDSLIFAKVYQNLGVEFGEILKSLDEAVKKNEERYFKLNEKNKVTDDINIYGWRQIAIKLLDSLLILFPEVDKLNAGKVIAQEALKDSTVASIVKQQILIRMRNSLSATINERFVDFKSCIERVTSFNGNIFQELPLEDQYHVLDEYVYRTFEYYKEFRKKYSTRDSHVEEVLESLDDPGALYGLSNKLDEKKKLLGEELIDFVSFPNQVKLTRSLWFSLSLSVEFLLSEKNSKFSKNFENQITSSALKEKLELLKEIVSLLNRVEKLKTNLKTLSFQCNKMNENEVWKQLGEKEVISWFRSHWEQQGELLTKVSKQRKDLERLSYKFYSAKPHDSHSKADPEESLSVKLGGWINTQIISELWSFLYISHDDRLKQSFILQKAIAKNSERSFYWLKQI